MTLLEEYIFTVTHTRLFNEFEKAAFLDHPEELSPEYMQQIVAILQGFDSRSSERQREYLSHIAQSLATYEQKIQAIPGISEAEKAEYIARGASLVKIITEHLQALPTGSN